MQKKTKIQNKKQKQKNERNKDTNKQIFQELIKNNVEFLEE